MNAKHVSLTNRRLVLLAVMSLVASLLAISVGAPSARATNENFTFAGATDSVAEDGVSINVPVTLTADEGNLLQLTEIDVELDGSSTATNGSDFSFSSPTKLSWALNDPPSTKNVTITITDDDIDDDGETIVLNLVNPNPGTATTTGFSTITITITDNDTAGVTVTESGGSTDVTEGTGNDTYDVVLDTEPTASVTVNVTPDGEITTNAGGSLTFTTGDWDMAQTVTVTAVDDLDIEGSHTGTITQTASSVDSNYNGIGVADVIANITDDEAAPTVQFTAATSNAGESTATHNISITLDTSGGTTTSPITVNISDAGGGTATSGTDYNASFGAAVFPPGSTDSAVQNATITVVPDTLIEGNETINLGFGTITGATASGTTSHTHTINDDDTAGVTVTESGGSTDVTEGIGNDTYDVVLTSEPTDDVIITILTPDGEVTTDSGGSLTFTSADWFTAQTVTVTAADDGDYEPSPHPGVITQTAASGDPNYDAIPVADVTANITDDDEATVAFTNASSNAEEDGGVHTITVTLTLPNGTGPVHTAVEVDISVVGGSATGGGDDYTLLTNTVTFGVGTADGATRNINIDIDDDGLEEGNETIDLQMSVTAGGIGGAQTTHEVTIIDDETRNLIITPTAASTVVAEAGGTDSFDVRLTQAPTGTVTVTLSKTAEGDEFTTVPATTLLFNAGNWMVDQTVNVTGVDDDIIDGDRPGEITLTASGGGYDGVIGTESVTITDDDSAGATVVETGSTAVTEGGAADTYTIVLEAEPDANVTIDVVFDDDELDVS
ncbi:MAG: Calx-beta domain-containing protein, partial [Acidimicrobiia bacterium]|nr:Calx-beta domain-containing protein [Acidimicrobiia bacterium]